MKLYIFSFVLISFCSFNSINGKLYSQTNPRIDCIKKDIKIDSVYLVIRELVAPSTRITRTSKLDSAAAFHANYLIAGKKTGHYEEDQPLTKTPMRRAEKFGDGGLGIYEVCWAGATKYNSQPNSVKGAIHYFKFSDKHWDIMTRGVSQFSEIRFGYSRIESKDWSVCVIIYSTGPEPIRTKK
jgi:hypothetical protein